MNILDMLYTLIIGPLKLLFEVIYTISYYITNSAGLSIIVLSIVMNVLLLPLYNRADKMQEEENEIEKKLKHGVDHIKKTFKGDERYMILQTYYRQNNYKQTNVLKGSISLLLEIPFFIAAYDFLSNLGVIKGASFLLISNLAKPDGLLNGINILPILMTLINIVSSIIYTKGQPLKSKIQLYLMALLFLVLLYDRPSALVFYWTLNNAFSLLKNIYIKHINNKKIIYILLSLISIGGIIYLLFNPLETKFKQYSIILIFLLLNIPLLLSIRDFRTNILKNINSDNRVFVLCSLFIAILIGLLIPSNVIVSSPLEFIDNNSLINPNTYIVNCFLLSIGSLILWFNIYYFLMSDKVKKCMNLIAIICVCIAIANYFFFGNNLGTLSNLLIYENGLDYNISEMAINVIINILIIIIINFIFKFLKEKMKKLIIISVLAMSIVSIINIKEINASYYDILNNTVESDETNINIQLSKNGKNVIVIMLDRAISSYVPYIFKEKEFLLDDYSGFTYYPNTISFAASTRYAFAALYGGYEYTPININNRKEDLLKDKQREALCVLPSIFNDNNYYVTIFDPDYSGYVYGIEDFSIYDNYKNVHPFTTKGVLQSDSNKNVSQNLELLNRNLFCHSITKVSPLIFQTLLYNSGLYNSIDNYNSNFGEQIVDNLFRAHGTTKKFVDNCAVLDNLSLITTISDKYNGTFTFISNEITHEPSLLQMPDYTIETQINNEKINEDYLIKVSINGDSMTINNESEMKHYHANMKAYLLLDNYFKFLKDNDCYDNTRIILVSDHGQGFDNPINLSIGGNKIMSFNALLMVKDFNSKEFYISDEFMTIADVPTIATKEIIKNPINVFTGYEINDHNKNGKQMIIIPSKSSVNIDDYIYEVNDWLYVSEDIFNIDNWKYNNK